MFTWPVAPMKAVSGRLPEGDGWVYEPKWDGHRALVRIRGDRVDIASSTGKDRHDRFPWLVDVALAAVNGTEGDVVLDGEVVAYTDDGRHSFQAVGRADRPHAFVAFDVLALGGDALLDRPWHERRDLLVAEVAAEPPLLITPVTTDAATMVSVTTAKGFEGVIAKRVESRYQPGRRSPSWVKLKHRHQQEMVVGGYKVGEGARAATFGSLLVGVHDGTGALTFVGAVGTGFDDPELARVAGLLADLPADECPFGETPRLPGRPQLCWVQPELVVQVSFAEWTDGGGIRAPVYHGIRDDVDPATVVRET